MTEQVKNPLDDELLKELGLEPREAPEAKKKTPTPDVGKKPAGARPSPVSPPKKPIKPESVPKAPSKPAQADERFSNGVKNLAQDMPVQVVAVLGKRTMTLRDVVSLKQGEILDLKKLPQDTVDLVVNGKLLARGELVLIDGKVGIQIKQLFG